MLAANAAAESKHEPRIPTSRPCDGWRTVLAECAPFPESIDVRLICALGARAFSSSNAQAEAIAHALAGRHVVTVTPTASGKKPSLRSHRLDAILKDPASARVLFRRRALRAGSIADFRRWPDALDQQDRIIQPEQSGTSEAVRSETPIPRTRTSTIGVSQRMTPTRRPTLVDPSGGRAQIVSSNPRHAPLGILPHHPRWAKLFGACGSSSSTSCNMIIAAFSAAIWANIHPPPAVALCRHYGSEPTFICSSATIANPRDSPSAWLCCLPFRARREKAAHRAV